MIPDSSAQQDKPPTFERIEEYKAILDNLAGLSLRRQNTNNVYVGLNTIFLTALGVFISTRLNFMIWSTAVGVGVMALPLIFLNSIWLRSLLRYERGAEIRYDYLREIEQEFQRRSGVSDDKQLIGLFTRIKVSGMYRSGNTQLEGALATFFLIFYPSVSLVIVLLTWLVQSHTIPPLPFP